MNKTMGQLAFEVFNEKNQEDLPPLSWDQLEPELRDDWERATMAVSRHYVTQYDRREDAKKLLEVMIAQTDVLTLSETALNRMVDISLAMVDMLITKTNTDAFGQVQVTK